MKIKVESFDVRIVINALREMRNNMDSTDVEEFNRFIEKHWGNRTKQTLEANSDEVEEKPKRRGRKPKKTEV